MPETTRPPAPPSVLRAAQVMYVGAAASLIGIVIDFLTRHAIRTALLSHNHKLTTAQLNTAYHVELGALVVSGLVAAGLWLWMAQSCKAGKSWARIVSTVLFGIDTLSQIAGAAVAGGGGARIFGLIVWLIGLAAIVLLWQRSSSAYFKGVPQ